MSLLDDLEDAFSLVLYCDRRAESLRAKMNFIINLITILEVHSRFLLGVRSSDELLDGAFTCNTILRLVSGESERRVIRELTKIRNAFVHEGRSTEINNDQINLYYNITKSILNNGQRNNNDT